MRHVAPTSCAPPMRQPRSHCDNLQTKIRRPRVWRRVVHHNPQKSNSKPSNWRIDSKAGHGGGKPLSKRLEETATSLPSSCTTWAWKWNRSTSPNTREKNWKHPCPHIAVSMGVLCMCSGVLNPALYHSHNESRIAHKQRGKRNTILTHF